MSFTFGSSRTKSAANVSEKGRQHETWKKTRKSPFKQLGSFPSAEHRPFSRAPIAQIAYMAVGMPRDAGETNRKRRPRCSKQNLSEFMGFIYGVYLWNLWGISMYIYVYLCISGRANLTWLWEWQQILFYVEKKPSKNG